MLEFFRLLVRLGWPLRLVGPLFGRFHPYDPRYAVDPYPTYRRLREEAPVYLHPVFRAFVVSRYEDVEQVLKHPSTSVRRVDANVPDLVNPFRGLSERFRDVIGSTLLMTDPPDHTRIRNLVNRAFTPRVVESLRPRIQQVVDVALEEMAEKAADGPVDLVSSFAVPVPVVVIAEMLGVPADDREVFKHWSTELAALLDPVSSDYSLAQVERTFLEMDEYFQRLFAERRESPRDDLISRLVAIEDEGDRLTSVELIGVVALVLGAGHETTTNLIGNAVVALLRNPGERKRFQEEPALARSAVEEFLRYDSPVQATDRLVTGDLEVGGRNLSGRMALLLLGGANRDPERFPDPDRLDLSREDNRHLSFSQGAHFCLGAQLARVEAEVALGSLFRRFPDLAGDPNPPSWRRSVVLRGPESLPVKL